MLRIHVRLLLFLCSTAALAGAAGAAPTSSPPACRPSPLSAADRQLFDWAREMSGLKGDGDFRTMASDAYMQSYYAQGQKRLAAAEDLYAWDATCQGLLNYLGYDPTAYALLLQAGYRPERAPFYTSPLIDFIAFYDTQLEYTIDDTQMTAQFRRLAQVLDVNFRNPDGQRPLQRAQTEGWDSLVRILQAAGAE